jgi:hypothetical protein
MKTSKIKAGSKQRIKIGRNEIEVTVIGQKGKTWLVESSSGKKFPVGESRFIKDQVKPEQKVVKTPATKGTPVPKQKMSMLDAVVEILKDASHPMSSKELIAAMEDANLWKSPGGKTPSNTLSAAILRECKAKENPRFNKPAPGKFEIAERSQ